MHWRVVRTRLVVAPKRGCWRPRPPWSMGIVEIVVAWVGMWSVFRMDLRADDMRVVKESVKELDHSVMCPHVDGGEARTSEANRWVSLWRVLTLMVRRVVCLSWRPEVMAVISWSALLRT